MRFPDFILIGAAKSGTTALFSYLAQHPGIFACPVREPNFFALDGAPALFVGPGDRETVGRHSITEQAAYEKLFDAAEAAQVTGEVSPLYLYHPAAAGNIAGKVPGCKLVVVLRDPVARAFASFLHLRRDGREVCEDFEVALSRERSRQAARWEHLWHYEAMGRYGEQLERYLAHFPREQILVVLYEDFLAAPAAVLSRCFAFLGVDARFTPDFSRKSNRSGIPRWRGLQRFVTGQSTAKKLLVKYLPESVRGRLLSRVQQVNLARPKMDAGIARRLREGYRQDLLKLQDVIGRDLSAWLPD